MQSAAEKNFPLTWCETRDVTMSDFGVTFFCQRKYHSVIIVTIDAVLSIINTHTHTVIYRIILQINIII